MDETLCTCGCPASEHCLDDQCCSWDKNRSLGTECILFRCSCSGYWPLTKKEEQPAEVIYHKRRFGPCMERRRKLLDEQLAREQKNTAISKKQ